MRYTPPPRSAASNSTLTVPDFAPGETSDPRTLAIVGAMSSRSVIAARGTARRIGVEHLLGGTPPQPAVITSALALRPVRPIRPNRSPPQPALGRQPSMSTLSTLI